jgi:hypothetical protein
VAACKKFKVAPGVHAVGVANAVECRREEGFKLITVISDIVAMKTAVASSLAAARGQK